MSTDDIDLDSLIGRLSGPLPPDARQAFRCAAEDALARIVCQGEGAAYRALVPIWRQFFDPPPDARTGRDIHHDLRASKLRDGAPLKHDDLRRVRYLRPAGQA